MSAEPLAVDRFHPLRERSGEGGPRWRAAVLHHQDEQALHAMRGLVEQIRAANCMAIPIEVPLSDPFIDHYDEWRGRASRGVYDLVLLVGPFTPLALAFAVLVDAPIIRVPSTEAFSISSIETAMACGHLDEVPVAEITLDDVRRIFANYARITAEGPIGFECRLEPSGGTDMLRSCDVRPGAKSHLGLEVQIDGAGPIRCEHVEITGRSGTFLVELDGRPRRPTIARLGATPQPLKILRTDKYP